MNIFAVTTWKTMKKNKARTIVSVIGVILATAMVTAVVTFGYSIQKFMLDYAVSTDGYWHVSVDTVDETVIKDLGEDSDVKQTAAFRELGYAKPDYAGERHSYLDYIYIQTVSQEAEDMLKFRLSEGRLPENENEIVLQSDMMNFYDKDGNYIEALSVGDNVTLTVGDRISGGEKLYGNPWLSYEYVDNDQRVEEEFVPKYERTYTVVGVLEHWGGSKMGAGSDAFTGEGENPQYSEEDKDAPYNVYLELKNPRDLNRFLSKIRGSYAYTTNESVLKWMGVSANTVFNVLFKGILSVLILIIGVGAVFLIYNTFSISLKERTVQFGIMSSVGASHRQLKRAMWYEALFVGIIGIPLGLISGVGGIGVTLHFIGPWIGGWINGSGQKVEMNLSVTTIPLAVFLVTVILCIAVWVPVRRVRRISPLEAIRSVKDVKISRKEVKSPAWILKIFGTEGMLADKNYKRDRRKYRTTVLSLVLSILLFVSSSLLSVYIGNTRDLVMEMPEYQLLYTTNETDEGISEQVDRILMDTDGIQEYRKYEIRSITVSTEDGREYYSSLIILDDNDFKQCVKNPNADMAYYDRVMSYNNETQRFEEMRSLGGKNNVKVDLLQYAVSQDEEGNYEETVTYKESVTISESLENLPGYLSQQRDITILIPQSTKSMYPFFERLEGIQIQAAIKAESYNQVFDALQSRLIKEGMEGKGYLWNYGAEYDQNRGMMISMNVLTYGFVILISLIAAANVFNTVSTNIMLRKREFAMLRSMGMNQKMMNRMLGYECMIYGIKSIIYGSVGAFVISFFIWTRMNAGVDVEFIQPWKQLGAALLWVMAVVIVTIVYAVWKLKEQNIVEELKRE